MPCLLALLAFFFPRFVIVLLVLFGNYVERTMPSGLLGLVVGILLFLFMPFTLLAYAFAYNQTGGSIGGIYLVPIVLGVLLDLGVIGGGAKARKSRTRTVVVRRRD